jgi:hypothetical protein
MVTPKAHINDLVELILTIALFVVRLISIARG